jgi:hypothetical protein
MQVEKKLFCPCFLLSTREKGDTTPKICYMDGWVTPLIFEKRHDKIVQLLVLSCDISIVLKFSCQRLPKSSASESEALHECQDWLYRTVARTRSFIKILLAS